MRFSSETDGDDAIKFGQTGTKVRGDLDGSAIAVHLATVLRTPLNQQEERGRRRGSGESKL